MGKNRRTMYSKMMVTCSYCNNRVPLHSMDRHQNSSTCSLFLDVLFSNTLHSSERHRRYYQDHKEERKNYNTLYYAQNRSKVLATQHKLQVKKNIIYKPEIIKIIKEIINKKKTIDSFDLSEHDKKVITSVVSEVALRHIEPVYADPNHNVYFMRYLQDRYAEYNSYYK